MEYADGDTLRNYLKENFNALTWDDKYNLVYQLTYALSCLHDEGIMHRDLVIIFKNIICIKISQSINIISLIIIYYYHFDIINSTLITC